MDDLEDVEDLPSLIRQSDDEPRYSPAEIILIEEDLARFDELVAAAYLEIECMPEGARMRASCKRKLEAKW